MLLQGLLEHSNLHSLQITDITEWNPNMSLAQILAKKIENSFKQNNSINVLEKNNDLVGELTANPTTIVKHLLKGSNDTLMHTNDSQNPKQNPDQFLTQKQKDITYDSHFLSQRKQFFVIRQIKEKLLFKLEKYSLSSVEDYAFI